VSASADSTVLVWDLSDLADNGLPRRPAELTAEELDGLWENLTGADAAAAHRAIDRLAAAPVSSTAFLGKRIEPVSVDGIDQWIRELDDHRFERRQRATQKLTHCDFAAEPALRQALGKGPPLEVRRRVDRLLENLEGAVTAPEGLGALRGIAVLERVNTTEARDFLARLAKGAPSARLTREAKSALERLAERPRREP
jgi:hypothetical protein